MPTIPEEDVHITSSVARQVFPEAIPSDTTQESKAKEAEHIPAASAKENEEEQVVIPLAGNVEIPELIVSDPPVN